MNSNSITLAVMGAWPFNQVFVCILWSEVRSLEDKSASRLAARDRAANFVIGIILLCEYVTGSSDQTLVHRVRASRRAPYKLQSPVNQWRRPKRIAVDMSTSPVCVLGCVRLFFFLVCMYVHLIFCCWCSSRLVVEDEGYRLSREEKKKNLFRLFSLMWVIARQMVKPLSLSLV
jgi:hypothetical protein